VRSREQKGELDVRFSLRELIQKLVDLVDAERRLGDVGSISYNFVEDTGKR